MCSSRLVAGAATLLLTLLARPTGAGAQLQAGPTLLEIDPQATSTRLLLRNPGEEAVAAHVRAYAWSQPEGDDLLVASEDLAVSPPIVEVPAGGEQVVRVVHLGPPVSSRDLTYRLVVDELPRTESEDPGRVKLRVRYVIPVFIRASGAPPPTLDCRIDHERARLACENRGGRPAQLGATRLVADGSDGLVLSEGLLGYVLPASRRTWVLPAPPPAADGSALHLETRLNGQPTTLVVNASR